MKRFGQWLCGHGIHKGMMTCVNNNGTQKTYAKQCQRCGKFDIATTKTINVRRIPTQVMSARLYQP